eukprot:gene13758-biopygen12576
MERAARAARAAQVARAARAARDPPSTCGTSGTSGTSGTPRRRDVKSGIGGSKKNLPFDEGSGLTPQDGVPKK